MRTMGETRPGAPGADARRVIAARRRARAKMEFYSNLVVFLFVGGMLALIDLAAAPGAQWAPAVIALWTVVLGVHWVEVFMLDPAAPVRPRFVEREAGG